MALSCMGRPYEMPYGIITGGFAANRKSSMIQVMLLLKIVIYIPKVLRYCDSGSS